MALKSVLPGGRLHHPLLPPGLVMPVMMVGRNVHRVVVDSVANEYVVRLRVKLVAWPITRLMPTSISFMLPDAGQRVSNRVPIYTARR